MASVRALLLTAHVHGSVRVQNASYLVLGISHPLPVGIRAGRLQGGSILVRPLLDLGDRSPETRYLAVGRVQLPFLACRARVARVVVHVVPAHRWPLHLVLVWPFLLSGATCHLEESAPDNGGNLRQHRVAERL